MALVTCVNHDGTFLVTSSVCFSGFSGGLDQGTAGCIYEFCKRMRTEIMTNLRS
jgi:hypothetical protein